MSTMPPSPFISADSQPSADAATAEQCPQPAAVAEPLPSNEGGHQGAPAVETNPLDAGATDCIGEIFIGARKLRNIDDLIDWKALEEAVEPLPLFLQRAMG